jgi:hypothetical protein
MLFFSVPLCHSASMSAPEKGTPGHSGSRSAGSWIGLTIPSLLLLYVLSVPPVVKFSGGRTSPAVRTFYAPVEFVYEHNDTFKKCYDWYFKLWRVK